MFAEENNFSVLCEDSEVIDVFLEDSQTSFESFTSFESIRSPKRCFSISDSSPFSTKRSRGSTPDISFSLRSPGSGDDYLLSQRSRFITKSVPIPEDDDACSTSNDRAADEHEDMPNSSSSAGFYSIACDVGSSFHVHHEREDIYIDLETEEDVELQEMFGDTEARMEPPPTAEATQSAKPKFQFCFPAAQQRSVLTPTFDKLHL
jgi:hypothetical protein